MIGCAIGGGKTIGCWNAWSPEACQPAAGKQEKVGKMSRRACGRAAGLTNSGVNRRFFSIYKVTINGKSEVG